MKDILEIAFRGECKAPVAEGERRGQHYFCAAPTRPGSSYCEECGRRMTVPVRQYTDAQASWVGGSYDKDREIRRTELAAALRDVA